MLDFSLDTLTKSSIIHTAFKSINVSNFCIKQCLDAFFLFMLPIYFTKQYLDKLAFFLNETFRRILIF